MKMLLSCALLALLHHSGLAQSPTPSPFPGWANKGATPNPAATGGSDKQQLLGTWEGFVSEGDDTRPGQRRMNVSLTITPDKITSGGAGNIGEGTYRISGSNGKLQQIDGTGTGGIYRGKVYQGIFTLEGNTLKWCSSDASRPRPTILRTNYAAGQYLIVLTRKQ
ncbi:MAG: hypothetical protein ABJF10_16665 [Chthoniobacter sp.]|uniref:hypothetical protein n=1 Tax=Chthoniobacter sp. TaxID=2510640 RepID=UPI0032ABCE33